MVLGAVSRSTARHREQRPRSALAVCIAPLLVACLVQHRRPLALPTSPPRTVRGVWGHEALRSCSQRASDGDWAPSAACLASIDDRVRREAAAGGRAAPDGEVVDRLYLPYTLRGRRYVLAIVYPIPLEGGIATFPFSRAWAAVPYACGASDGGNLIFEETYVVGAPESDPTHAVAGAPGLEATAKALASCTGESGVTWQTACADYEPPEDGTIAYADPCAWYYEASPPNVVAPGRYDRAALAEARRVFRTRQDGRDSLAQLVGLTDLCERRCTRSARAEIWELRGAVAREMGWQDGARRAFAEAASLQEDRTPPNAP